VTAEDGLVIAGHLVGGNRGDSDSDGVALEGDEVVERGFDSAQRY